MNHAPPELDIIAAFRRQLAELPEPPQRVRRAPAIAAAAAFAAVPLVTVLAGTDASSQALAITRTATTLELRIADASAQPDELTRELNDAGIRGRVLVIPSRPRGRAHGSSPARLPASARPASRRPGHPRPQRPCDSTTSRTPEPSCASRSRACARAQAASCWLPAASRGPASSPSS